MISLLFFIPSDRKSPREFREMKRLPFLVSLALINTMFCVYKGGFPVSCNFYICKRNRGKRYENDL